MELDKITKKIKDIYISDCNQDPADNIHVIHTESIRKDYFKNFLSYKNFTYYSLINEYKLRSFFEDEYLEDCIIEWLSQSNLLNNTELLLIDIASKHNHLKVIKWLHINNYNGCSTFAIDIAACNNYLEIVKFLSNNRLEGCSTNAVDCAAKHGHLDMVKWLYYNRGEGLTTYAIDFAARNGDCKMVHWLYSNTFCGYTDLALLWALKYNHIDMIKLLCSFNIPEHFFLKKLLKSENELGRNEIFRFLENLIS